MVLDIAIAQEVPHDLFKRRSWIRHHLRLNHTSLSDIARRADVTRQAVSAAIAVPQSPRLASMVASAIGVPPETLFPEIFLPSGEPRRHSQEPTQGAPAGRVESAGRD